MKFTIRIAMVAFFLTGLCFADQSSSTNTVKGFYDWYLKADPRQYRDDFSQAKPFFTDELYGMLNEGFKNGQEDDFWIDFDPFIAAQMSADKVNIGKSSSQGGNLDMVPVSPVIRGHAPDEPTVKVYCVQQGDRWVIANIAYPGDMPFELKTYLKDGLGK